MQFGRVRGLPQPPVGSATRNPPDSFQRAGGRKCSRLAGLGRFKTVEFSRIKTRWQFELDPDEELHQHADSGSERLPAFNAVWR